MVSFKTINDTEPQTKTYNHFGMAVLDNGVGVTKAVCGEPIQEGDTVGVDVGKVTCRVCHLKIANVIIWAMTHTDAIPHGVRMRPFQQGYAF